MRQRQLAHGPKGTPGQGHGNAVADNPEEEKVFADLAAGFAGKESHRDLCTGKGTSTADQTCSGSQKPFSPLTIGFTLVCAVAVVMLFLASDRHSARFYQYLRIAVCAAGVYGFCLAPKLKASGLWMVAFAAISILFNPIIPVHLSKATWKPIDLVAAVVLLIAVFWAYYCDSCRCK
jgi:hypothetical protein